jgi:hypothetical protein
VGLAKTILSKLYDHHGETTPNSLEEYSTTKRDVWSIVPLKLKTATPPILVVTMRWRASSNLNTTRLNTPTK